MESCQSVSQLHSAPASGIDSSLPSGVPDLLPPSILEVPVQQERMLQVPADLHLGRCQFSTESDSDQQELRESLKPDDAMDIMKPEKEMFSSEEEDDEAAKAVKQAMEAVSKAMGPRTDSIPTPSSHVPMLSESKADIQTTQVLSCTVKTRKLSTKKNTVNVKQCEKNQRRKAQIHEHNGVNTQVSNNYKGKQRIFMENSSKHEDNEALMDLQVQFQESSSADTTRTMKSTSRNYRTMLPRKRGRNTQTAKTPCQAYQVMRLSLIKETFEAWRQIGKTKGLSTDTAIATFLVQLYDKYEDKYCSQCDSQLVMQCPHCTVAPSCPESGESTLAAASAGEVSVMDDDVTVADSNQEEEDDDEEEEEGVVVNASAEAEPSPLKQRKRGRGREPFVCKECGSQFSRSGGLKVHMRIHTGEKPYKCDQCGEAFSQSGQLTVHIRKHTGERPFVCEECGASFPLSGSLKQHMRIHTGEKPFACPHCDKQFSYAGDLTVHLRKHSGDKPFLCQDCGKAFAVSSDLTKHKKIHSGDKPFPCTECGKAFPFLNRLTAHMRTHTGDKPFLCQECGAAFSRASNLTVHKRVHHTFEKPFKCPECGMAFSDSANLSKHKKNKHRKENKVKEKKLECSSSPLTKVDDVTQSAGDGVARSAMPVCNGPSIFPHYNYYYYQQQQPAQYLDPSTS